jgi:hypothetical protein
MYAIVSLNDAKYQPLADLTWDQNKKLYAEKHGYMAINKTDNFVGNIALGFEKLFFIHDLMEEHPELEWVWWTGTDSMVTNFTTKIEDKIDNDYELILATDCNEINNDSFLIKNSEWSRAYLKGLCDLEPHYKNHFFYEQQAMIESYLDNRDSIKIVPQRYLNAYRNELYPHQTKYDQLGTDGTWQKGDWLVHWPGTGMELRLQLASIYAKEVVQ